VAPGLLGWDELNERAAAARDADRASVAALRARVSPEDPITMVYTSGTTGPPKGVILTHHGELYDCAAIDREVELPDGLTVVSYLIKRFAVLPAEWTAESEELTPTMKLKRRLIHDKYAVTLG
jgi:long-subunit acyl-CoA synthetase (AMP-forming)